ncbi:hypothetical protein MKZ17_18585 [Solibacillus sp. FSL R7-0682]|uniref:hypothetical protein n=1 Tax=Solibacillus sp. FSL R7-0682 TaxID=2921690 RepID=UPI0030F72CF8
MYVLKKIELMKDGYEIVVAFLEHESESQSAIIEADAYYKDFGEYRILILADSKEKVIDIATKELPSNHPFEQVVRELSSFNKDR